MNWFVFLLRRGFSDSHFHSRVKNCATVERLGVRSFQFEPALKITRNYTTGVTAPTHPSVLDYRAGARIRQGGAVGEGARGQGAPAPGSYDYAPARPFGIHFRRVLFTCLVLT